MTDEGDLPRSGRPDGPEPAADVVAAYDRLLEAIHDDRPPQPFVDALVSLRSDPLVRRDLAEEVCEALEEFLPSGDEATPGPDCDDDHGDVVLPVDRIVEAMVHLVESAGLTDWANILLIDLDESSPAATILDRVDRVLALGGADPDDVAGLLVVRGRAHQDLGARQAAEDDLLEAHRLGASPAVRRDAVLAMAALRLEGDDLDAAADWAWRYTEERGPDEDDAALPADEKADVVQYQLFAVDRAHRPRAGITQRSRELLDRVESVPDWVSAASLTRVHAVLGYAALADGRGEAAEQHLVLGREAWSEALDAEDHMTWHIVDGMAGMARDDLRRVEEALRACTLVVDRTGHGPSSDSALAGQLAVLTEWLAWTYGTMPRHEEDDIVTVMGRVQERMVRGQVDESDRELLDRSLHGAREGGDVDEIAPLLLLRSAVHIALGRFDAGRADHAELEELVAGGGSWNNPSVRMGLRVFRAVVTFTQDPRDGVVAMDAAWRECLQAGTLHGVAVAAAASSAAAGWLGLGETSKAVAAAVVALTTHQDLTASRHSSVDRVDHNLSTTIRDLLVRSVAALDDPRLLAEALEVLRAQDMPTTGTAAASISDLSALFALAARAAVNAPDRLPSSGTGTTRLRPPPLVEMPWGTVALEGRLAYDPTLPRGRAEWRLEWPDLSKT